MFQWLQAKGHVADAEMHRVFNCGIGMVLVVAPGHVKTALDVLKDAGEQAWLAGEIVARGSGEAATVVRQGP